MKRVAVIMLCGVGDELVCLMVQTPPLTPPAQPWKVRERTEIINIVKVDNYLASVPSVPMSHHNLRKEASHTGLPGN